MLNFNFSDVEQNSDEWLDLRKGKSTASNFGKICANMGKAFGEPAKKYARKKALERKTGKLNPMDNFSNAMTRRGHELEPLAIQEYEISNFVEVKNGGFFYNKYIGDSPDGLVGNDGVIEVKSVIAETHWQRIEKGGFDTKYKWQIFGHLFCTYRDWCDFISYCPEFSEDKQLYTFRVYRDEKIIQQLEDRLYEFEALIQKKQKLL